MSPLALREIINTTIQNHPPDCIFGPDPVEGAMKYLGEHGSTLVRQPFGDFFELIIEAIQSQEIYCPHENIDRRP